MQKETIKYSIFSFLLLLLLRLQKEKLKGRQGKTRTSLLIMHAWVWKLQNIKCGIICQSELNNNDYVGQCFVISSQGGISRGVRRSVL
jgi:hypothetical protein